MRKYLKIAAGIALLVGVLINAQVASAQVYSQYIGGGVIVQDRPYTELDPFNKEVIPASSFGLPPSFAADPDDGYHQITLPFPFEYNDEVYNTIWVSVNGFVTFSDPLALPATEPRGLFIDEPSSYPTNVLAPFWGDHYYRTSQSQSAGYMPSEISYISLDLADSIDGDDAFVVQWKDLNINDPSVESSVANFQLWIFKSANPTTFSGHIMFCYGPIGGNPYTDRTEVITRNASVGLKGTSTGFNVGAADFLNGLYPNDIVDARTETTLTNQWPPTGATDRCLLYESNALLSVACCWGDGDADLSKAMGSRHFGLPQNRFVTYSDVKMIIRAEAIGTPLDSVRKRAAFHADVNHNGRFYFTTEGVRTDIDWASMNYADDLPSEINSIQRIFYQATEYDAAIILSYLAAKVPDLPWILDTIVNYGKMDVASVDGIGTGEITNVSGNLYQMPVYLNNQVNGPMSLNMTLDKEVVDVAVNNDDISFDYSDSKVVLAAFGKIDNESPVCIVTFRSENPELNISDIRYNDKNVDDIAINMSSTEENTDNGVSVTSVPNPFTTNTTITVANLSSGDYELTIYDLLGNKVKTLENTSSTGSIFTANWDGTNMSGASVESGMYIFKLTGNNVTITDQIVLTR